MTFNRFNLYLLHMMNGQRAMFPNEFIGLPPSRAREPMFDVPKALIGSVDKLHWKAVELSEVLQRLRQSVADYGIGSRKF